jgi:flagellin
MPRINHNIPAMASGDALRYTERDVQRSLERLSTGYRINRASDDVAGLSVSEQMRTQVRGLHTGSRNIQDGISLMNIADGAMTEIEDMLQRMRELSVEAASDTLTTVERTYVQTEVGVLQSEVDRLAAATKFNNMQLLNGTTPWGAAPGGVFHIGPNNTATADIIQYQIAAVNTTALGIDTMTMTSQSDAVASTGALDTALQSVNELRADLGAVINRLEHALNNQDNQETNMQAAESVIRDADFARESSVFAKNQIMTQSATAMLAQANMLPQNVLNLLK